MYGTNVLESFPSFLHLDTESALKMSKRKMLFVQLPERRITFNRKILNSVYWVEAFSCRIRYDMYRNYLNSMNIKC